MRASDSFHFALDDGPWQAVGFNPGGEYTWTRYHHNLTQGPHTLQLGIRERDARIDRILITNGEATPQS